MINIYKNLRNSGINKSGAYQLFLCGKISHLRFRFLNSRRVCSVQNQVNNQLTMSMLLLDFLEKYE